MSAIPRFALSEIQAPNQDAYRKFGPNGSTRMQDKVALRIPTHGKEQCIDQFFRAASRKGSRQDIGQSCRRSPPSWRKQLGRDANPLTAPIRSRWAPTFAASNGMLGADSEASTASEPVTPGKALSGFVPKTRFRRFRPESTCPFFVLFLQYIVGIWLRPSPPLFPDGSGISIKILNVQSPSPRAHA